MLCFLHNFLMEFLYEQLQECRSQGFAVKRAGRGLQQHDGFPWYELWEATCHMVGAEAPALAQLSTKSRCSHLPVTWNLLSFSSLCISICKMGTLTLTTLDCCEASIKVGMQA